MVSNKKQSLIKKITTIFLDAEDVLYQRSEKTTSPIINFLKNFRKTNWNNFQRVYQSYHLKTCRGEITKESQLKFTLRTLKINLTPSQFRNFQQTFRKHYSKIEKINGVENALRSLKKMGEQIIVISDTLASKKQKSEQFRYLGIDKYIDEVFCSSETGYTKDQTEAFSSIIKKSGLKSGEVLFLGHKKYEIKGAKRAGLLTVSFDRDVNADFVVKNISELPEIIS